MRKIAPSLLVGFALLVGGASAQAQEGVLVKNLLGSIGILPPEKDPIRYNERAPLVLPPKMELREPSAGGARTANPQWPNDPDVLDKRRRAAEARRPVTESETRRMGESSALLTQSELRAGRIRAAGPEAPVIRRGDNARDELLLSPDVLRAGASRDDDTQVAATVPLRRTLTDPPSEMRRTSTGKPPPKTVGSMPRVDTERSEADPREYLRQERAGASDD
jgi:hypothetical protein